jgi:hypothetical protein
VENKVRLIFITKIGGFWFMVGCSFFRFSLFFFSKQTKLWMTNREHELIHPTMIPFCMIDKGISRLVELFGR